MNRVISCALTLIIAVVVVSAQTAQPAQGGDPGVTATRVVGKVTEVNGPAGQMTVKTDAGSVVTVKVSEKTTYERMPPGETDRTKAVKILLTDIAAGDGVYARGYVSEDRKSVPAQTVIVVSQSDIAKKQEKERNEWRQRGILGTVSALNPTTKEITVTTRSLMGPQPVVIPVSDNLKMLRYAPDSIRFSDAKPSSLSELKVGDQLRALGERSADGARFTAEKVVTGSFRTVGGVVTAIDAATGEVKINELQSKQPLTVVIKQDAVLRRFPSDIAAMMMGGGPGGPGGAPGAPRAGAPGSGGPGTAEGRPPQGGGQGPGGGMRGGGGGNIQAMLEQLPTIGIADLKVGDTIIVSSTTGADPVRLTAITLVTGADTLLNLLAARQPQGGAPGGGAAAAGAGGGGGIGFFGSIGP